eukprot:GFKZ01009395.1.p1 GENE.GFKZ01009395.1~~GFKZ01009395.1.p1  ORF type:complete len:749 (+),score=158.87 GFKZ01009395.1:204-2450(+)
MSRYSVDTLDEAREALRRLSSDVSAFRSPAVQQHLNSPSDSTSNPALQAQIIALRTELHDMSELHKTSKQQLHSAKKRAASAEALVKELEADLKAQQLTTSQLELTAADRIQQLETDKKNQEIAANQTASVLRNTVERDRLGYPAVVAQRDQLEAKVKRLEENIVALQKENDSARDKLQFQKKSAQREQDRLQQEVEDLEAELKYIRSEFNSSKRKDSTDQVESEVKRLRKQVIDMERQENNSRKELDSWRNKVTKLQDQVDVSRGDKERLAALESEVRSLRTEKDQIKDLAQQAKSLMKEREQIISLVSGLSETGSVQEGLAILTNAAGGKPLGGGKGVGSHRDPGSSDTVVQQHQRGIDEMRAKETEAVSRLRIEIRRLEEDGRATKKALQRAESERDAALESSKSSERVRRIMQVENKCFKEALERIEKEFDKPVDPDGSVTRLRERCAAYEKTTMDYQRTIAQLEHSLRESRAEVRKLSAEVVDLKTARKLLGSSSDKGGELCGKIAEATRTAKSALDTHVAAGVKGQGTSEGQEGEGRHASTSKPANFGGDLIERNESGELDYDSSRVKVLHVKDNLLMKAIQAAEIAADAAKGKKRLRMAIESGSSPIRDSALRSQLEALVKEVEELTAKNANLEQRSKVGIRTGEIAKKKIEEVRSAVYNLFGWSMNIIGAKYTIASIYAESPDEYLEFGVNRVGTMSLMETEYTKVMAEEIDVYVKKMHSIPALLGHITMQNFEKTTALF